MEDSDSSDASSIPTSSSRGKPLCGTGIPNSPRQVTPNESTVLPPFQEISRIARKGQDDRRKYNTPPTSNCSLTTDMQEWRSNAYTSVPIETLILPKPRISSSPCLPSVSLPLRSPSPTALPYLPPFSTTPSLESHSPLVTEGNLSRPTTPGDEAKCTPIPVFDWDNYVPPEHGSGYPHPAVTRTRTNSEPQFDPLEARQRTGDEESTASEGVGYYYDPVESNWQKYCTQIVLDNGRAQFQCRWIRDDTKSGKCEYQGKRQLVQRHIETTHLNIRRYLCLWPGCNQRYGQKSSFNVHRRTHTGERPFKCKNNECHVRFNDPSGLLRHMVQEHQYKPKARKSNYPDGHLPITANRPRNGGPSQIGA